MKIIIAYASAGTGHRRAAEAVYNYLRENCPGADLKIIDALQKTNFIFSRIYTYGYLFLVNHALWLWHFCFWLTSIKFLRPVTYFVNSFSNRLNAAKLFDFLIDENADFVISTHFLPSEVTTYLKKKNKLTSRLITVITDFGVHPFWVLDGTDLYIVASYFSKEELLLRGVEANRIMDLGIPIDPKFSRQYDRDTLSKKFDINPDKFTVLISTGSSGIGDVEKIVKALCDEAQLLVVCAGNKILYARLKDKNYPQVKVFGFIGNMEELMAVSDMIISKPGGLTISESLAMGLFPVFITAIPGQETVNAKILARNSVGMNIKDVASVKNAVLDFRNHPDKLQSARDKINKLKRPFAVKEICNVVCQGSGRSAC